MWTCVSSEPLGAAIKHYNSIRNRRFLLYVNVKFCIFSHKWFSTHVINVWTRLPNDPWFSPPPMFCVWKCFCLYHRIIYIEKLKSDDYNTLILCWAISTWQNKKIDALNPVLTLNQPWEWKFSECPAMIISFIKAQMKNRCLSPWVSEKYWLRRGNIIKVLWWGGQYLFWANLSGHIHHTCPNGRLHFSCTPAVVGYLGTLLGFLPWRIWLPLAAGVWRNLIAVRVPFIRCDGTGLCTEYIACADGLLVQWTTRPVSHGKKELLHWLQKPLKWV